MNPNVIVFKYSLIVYSEYLKLKIIQKLNETEFFYRFQNSLLQNHLFLNSKLPGDDLCSLFLSHACTLCELEALAFMPDENIPLYKDTKKNINCIIQNMNELFKEKNYHFINTFTSNDWRKLISIIVTFKEWTDDIKYFEQDEQKRIKYLIESPLMSLCFM